MSQTVVALPRLIELRSQYNNRLLRYVKEEGAFLKGFVQSYGEHAGSADVKLEVHGSTTGNGLVHIRSCYNNKYLVLGERDFIVATAEKPEEDQSKRSCTLFRPTSVDENPKKIRLTNVHLGKMLRTWSYGGDYANCVLALRSEPDSFPYDVFNVMDWQSLVILPKYVAFKGDNGRFLRPLWFQNLSYLQFSLTNVENDPMLAGNEIVQTSDGTIHVRNMHWDTYWRLSPNWIWADSKRVHDFGDDELFEAVKYSDNKIALRNVKNKLFCTRLTTEGKESCLNAGSPTINTRAQLEVSDFVISRKIENFKFRLMDARIYDDSIVVMASSSHTNHAMNTIQEWTFDLSHKEMQSRTWNANLSLTASIEMSITVGIPLIEEGEVKMGLEFSGAYTWGETKEVEDELSIQFKNPIPPQTKVTTRLMATRATCDVPFTYTQRDVLYTGETVTSELDGVYTGINHYSYYTEVAEESLIKDPIITDAGFKKVAKVSRSGVITPI